jgi:hypothetical protein
MVLAFTAFVTASFKFTLGIRIKGSLPPKTRAQSF